MRVNPLRGWVTDVSAQSHNAPMGQLVTNVRELVGDDRVIIGLTGPPAAGKSTLARALVAALPAAAYLPMDGFHLANAQLDAQGLRGRKGAPDTFDRAGYRALLRRVRAEDGDIYAPDYDRALHEPIAGALLIPASARIVVTEGNYLAHPGWTDVRALLTELWYLDVPSAVREARLHARHVSHGKEHEEAWRWIAATDRPNALVVEASRAECDRVISAAHTVIG
ncbi:nucleoside/nucleotide kinase family protein [Pseudonocardiaceae bacterium YIM PH 21723]|nr:nucleoside/nucleotide kinase family protein [Pseudonocardiaceae bacterium YIM PH 21723]